MTYERTLQTGFGRWRWRVAIDGLPFEGVSHRAMERTAADGRRRFNGLRSDTLKFVESVHLPTAKWEPQGQRITLADINHRWTELFSREPVAVTYLDGNVAAGATTINVLSTASYPASNSDFWLDTEAIGYVSKTATSFLGCSRGKYGSLPQDHYSSFGAALRRPELTDWPVSIEGRRVRIYAYGKGDDPQGDGGNGGNPVWVGVARTEPTSDGARWSFTVDPLSSILDFEIGGDLEEPRSIRGIYYPWSAPLYLEIWESDTDDVLSEYPQRTALALAGFWESQEAFCIALTTLLAAAVASPTAGTFTQGPFRAEPFGESWRILFTTTATPRHVIVQIGSPIDGSEAGRYIRDIGAAGDITRVFASTTYVWELLPTLEQPTPGGVPRTCRRYNSSYVRGHTLPAALQSGIDPATNPEGRIYLSGSAPSAAVTFAQVTYPADTADDEPAMIAGPVVATDAAAASIDINIRYESAPFIIVGSETAMSVEVRMTRTIAEGHLGNFIDALTAATATYLNTGGVPYFRPTQGGLLADFDTSELAAAALGAGPLAESRTYQLLSPVDLRELIEHECRLLGVYMCSNAFGQITFKRLQLPAARLEASKTLDRSTIILDKAPVFAKSPHGIYNTVLYQLGYDPAADESTAEPVLVRDVVAFGRHPLPRVLDVTPKSIDPAGPISIDQLERLASRVLGVFGAPYAELTCTAPLTFFNTPLGSLVDITWRRVPSGLVDETARARGTLGVTRKVAQLVRREWTPSKASGVITLMISSQRVGGYAPAGKITQIVGSDGATGDFIVTLDSDYFPSGTDAESFFAAGHKVRVYRWGSTTATVVTGTVDSVAGNVVTWVSDAAWTHSAGTWAFGFDVSTTIAMDSQKRFVAIAGADGGLDWSGSSDNPPFTLAP